MKLTTEKTAEIVKNFGKDEKDSGNPSVQVALLTARISMLTEHLKEHKKDNHSRRGLLLMVGKRRRLLDYIKANNPEEYLSLLKELKIRK